MNGDAAEEDDDDDDDDDENNDDDDGADDDENDEGCEDALAGPGPGPSHAAHLASWFGLRTLHMPHFHDSAGSA